MKERTEPKEIKAIQFPSAEEIYEKLQEVDSPPLVGFSPTIDEIYLQVSKTLEYAHMVPEALASAFARMYETDRKGKLQDRKASFFVLSHFEQFVDAIVDDADLAQEAKSAMEKLQQENMMEHLSTRMSTN